MTVVLGEEEKQYFTDATDSAGDTYGSTVCGARAYKVIDITAGTEATVLTV